MLMLRVLSFFVLIAVGILIHMCVGPSMRLMLFALWLLIWFLAVYLFEIKVAFSCVEDRCILHRPAYHVKNFGSIPKRFFVKDAIIYVEETALSGLYIFNGVEFIPLSHITCPRCKK